MRIQHKRARFSGTEIHQARELVFVDGVAEAPDSVSLAAALAVKGYRVLPEHVVDVKEPETPVEDPKPKRGKKPQIDHSVEDDVPVVDDLPPTIDD